MCDWDIHVHNINHLWNNVFRPAVPPPQNCKRLSRDKSVTVELKDHNNLNI